MEDLYFSLNETMPVLLEMLFGAFLHKAGLLSDRFTDDLNKFVFKIALPMQLFHELAVQDFASAWDGRYVLFCFLATLLSIAIVSLLSPLIVKTKAERGEFIQAAYRSSAALLGVAFLQNMYGEGNTGMGPLMILGAVPLYNIFAVIVLMVTAEHSADDAAGRKKDSSLARKTFIGVITNPILDSILIGLIWSLLRIPTPKILFTSINNIGKTASPLGLIAMGSAFRFQSAREQFRPGLIAALIKLVGLEAVFLPLAVLMGFQKQQLASITIMLGSATTVTCFIMARNMNHKGDLTSVSVMLTTFGCAFTLTFWFWLLRSMHLSEANLNIPPHFPYI